MSLENKIAVITGSGQGIGRSIALKLADQGADIVISDMNAESANRVVEEIKARGRRSIAITANVTSADQVNALVEQTVATFGKIDILVNNAGITRDGLLLRMSDADWDAVISTNLSGAFLCTRAAIKHMIKQRWGRVINIASVVGVMGNAGQANYAAAKAGLIALTKTTAREVASRGVTANAIAPGFIDTSMTQKLPDKVKQEFQAQIPVGRFGTPEDIAHVAAFLAAEESHYITGQVIHVNGGMLMA